MWSLRLPWCLAKSQEADFLWKGFVAAANALLSISKPEAPAPRARSRHELR